MYVNNNPRYNVENSHHLIYFSKTTDEVEIILFKKIIWKEICLFFL